MGGEEKRKNNVGWFSLLYMSYDKSDIKTIDVRTYVMRYSFLWCQYCTGEKHHSNIYIICINRHKSNNSGTHFDTTKSRKKMSNFYHHWKMMHHHNQHPGMYIWRKTNVLSYYIYYFFLRARFWDSRVDRQTVGHRSTGSSSCTSIWRISRWI
jgi:hypothetical protein